MHFITLLLLALTASSNLGISALPIQKRDADPGLWSKMMGNKGDAINKSCQVGFQLVGMACVAASGVVPHETALGKTIYGAGIATIGNTAYDAANKWTKHFKSKPAPDLEQGQAHEHEALLRPDEHHEMTHHPIATTAPVPVRPATPPTHPMTPPKPATPPPKPNNYPPVPYPPVHAAAHHS